MTRVRGNPLRPGIGMSRRGSGLLGIVVTAAIAAASTSASAADLPVPGATYVPRAYEPALYNWTGFYLGGQFGLGLLQDAFTTGANGGFQTPGFRQTLSDTALIGGGQIGANYQMGQWVLGAETAWTSSNISASSIGTTLQPSVNQRATTNERWYASATARVGYAMNTLLLYAKGGAAWTRVDYTEALLGVPIAFAESSQAVGGYRVGFTVGGGIEYGLTENLSTRLEYDFYDFGTRTYTFGNLSYTPPGGVLTPVSLPMSIVGNTHVLTIGLNYRFN
jgi:outer membrane immunogenic protein